VAVNDGLDPRRHQPDLLSPPRQPPPQRLAVHVGLPVAPSAGQAGYAAVGHAPAALERIGIVEAATPLAHPHSEWDGDTAPMIIHPGRTARDHLRVVAHSPPPYGEQPRPA
jgi:hypothetical protein